ncbi:MAG: DUF433 domain-containing protein [Candidatus Hydrogenedentes bacterium]|nr:DUF433 domain-containing protein [Candidatus Hydrogenedentota bacterium]
MISYQQHISRDKQVCGGQPVVRGTRGPIPTILASLAEGATVEEILADFPSVTEPDIRAVIAFAAASAEEDLPVPELPRTFTQRLVTSGW